MPIGIMMAVAAVLIDSVVTCVVGYKLMHKADDAVSDAAETVMAALQAQFGIASTEGDN